MPASAQQRGWGRGWPANRQGDMVQVRGGGVSVPAGVHREIADLTRMLLDETVRRGYRLVSGWCWGYARRPIRGTLRPSNHSWGLAVDLNAPKNPQGGARGDIPDRVVALWERYGWEWGGRWGGRSRDPMHFEYAGTPTDARRHTAQLRADIAPKPSTPTTPSSPPGVTPSAPLPIVTERIDEMVTLVYTDAPNTAWYAVSGNTRRALAPGEPDALALLGVLNPRNTQGGKITPIYMRWQWLSRIPEVAP